MVPFDADGKAASGNRRPRWCDRLFVCVEHADSASVFTSCCRSCLPIIFAIIDLLSLFKLLNSSCNIFRTDKNSQCEEITFVYSHTSFLQTWLFAILPTFLLASMHICEYVVVSYALFCSWDCPSIFLMSRHSLHLQIFDKPDIELLQ